MVEVFSEDLFVVCYLLLEFFFSSSLWCFAHSNFCGVLFICRKTRSLLFHVLLSLFKLKRVSYILLRGKICKDTENVFPRDSKYYILCYLQE